MKSSLQFSITKSNNTLHKLVRSYYGIRRAVLQLIFLPSGLR